MKKHINIANVITMSRILFALFILISPIFSVSFYVWYILGALSDMIDGLIARKLHLQSEFGAKLDTIADGVFVIAAVFRICSSLDIPVWVWTWTGVIVFIKIVNLISAFIVAKGIVPMHTVMNKITGFLVFLLPLFVGHKSWNISKTAVIITGCIATFAAIQEGHYIRTGKTIE